MSGDDDLFELFLQDSYDLLDQWEAALSAIERHPDRSGFEILFRTAHNLKGMAHTAGLTAMAQLIHWTEDHIAALVDGGLLPSVEVTRCLAEVEATLRLWLEGLRRDRNFAPDQTEIREHLASLGVRQSEVTESIALLSDGLLILDDSLGALPQTASGASSTLASPTAKPAGTLRVSLDRIETILRLAGEIRIHHSVVQAVWNHGDQGGKAPAPDGLATLSTLISELQTEAMAMRLQPLDRLFRRLERTALEAAQDVKKSIEVIVRGASVELDSTVIERMRDPLVHIVRNAVDHGAESAIDRKHRGKLGVSTITIEGIQSASQVLIRVSDDGGGLDTAKIRAKAIEQKLLTADAKMSQDELNFIFRPGFSTADTVSKLSGRGIGLDVVRTTVDQLGGTIIVNSTPGVGTVFEIALPSHFGILDAVIVGIGNDNFAVPISDISEVVSLADVSIQKRGTDGSAIDVRGCFVPMNRLGDFLPQTTRGNSSERIALITTNRQGSVAFTVDRIEGQQSVVVRRLDGPLAAVPGLSGTTVLSSGEVGLILDMRFLARRQEELAA